MEQPVYTGGYGIRLIHQNPDEQQQQTNYIMASHQDSNQILIADESTGQHIVPHLQQQQQQYIQQDDGNQYMIQQQSPAPQQVFYANIQQSPQNVNRIIQQQQGNLMQQQTPQKQLVLQAQPKVIIQRTPDMLQSNPPPLVDQHSQQIQYSFQPQNIDQGQQIIIQQQSPQMKQTLYQQQTGQIVHQQPQYIQLQQGTKILTTQGSPIRYSIVSRPQQMNSPQQQQQQQQNHMIQVQPSPEQMRSFRPRVITAQMRVARPNSPQLPQIQMQQNRPRTPRMVPRLVRPLTPQHQQQQQQQTQQSIQRIMQPTGTRMAINNGQQYYIIQQQDGQQIFIAAPQNQHQNISSPPQLVRTSQAQVIPQPQAPSPQIQSPQQAQPQQLQQPQSEVSLENSEEHAPTTSTLPKKDGDCDDLEDSITATAISKSAQSASNESFRRLPTAAPQRVGIVRPMNVNRHPLPRNNALQIIRQRPPPRPMNMQPGGLQHALGIRERESAKMLVILDNGEQRLITFTLPKETCTVQELLDQVGIEVGADSNIECIENPSSEIDYIVKVGRFASREDTLAMTKAAENHIRQQAVQAQRMVQRPAQSAPQEPDANKTAQEAPKLPPAKFVDGFLAVCSACGFSGVDHAKCERCGRIFTNEVKSIRMPGKIIIGSNRLSITKANERKDQLEAIQKKHQLATGSKLIVSRRLPTTTMNPSSIQAKNRGRGPRAKPVAPEIVTLSSDDEDSSESKSSTKNGADTKVQINVVPRKVFEPEIHDIKEEEGFQRLSVIDFAEGEEKISTSLTCRSIRIGSYKFETSEKVDVTNKGIRIVAPSVTNEKDKVILDIQHSEIVKLITHFSKQLQIVFLYTKPSCARYIVDQLSMTLVNDRSPYYAPLSLNETQKKIVILIENVTDENKQTLRSIYTAAQIEDITNRDANELLVRSNGIPVNSPNVSMNASAMNDTGILANGDYKKLLTYPLGRGGIPITTYDYLCLGSDNYLNDVIIDFYLKYIHHDLIPAEQRAKSHIFSQFFYKRLTTMNKDKDNRTQTAAQKRHARVSSWTKNVNIFEKDFIIVPINEQSHWFLAIICFPNLTEPRTMDTDQPIKLVPAVKRTQKKSVQIGNTTITPLNKKEEAIELKDDASERDEAEGDDSELGSNAESDEEEVVDKGQAVKIPCILIFDSLGGASRARVVATLRDYLACEYRVKYPEQPPRLYSKTSMVGSIVKVPQQLNFTDCGLFLLQYVENFFKVPIEDFRLPIKTLMNWFPQDIVTRKREDISNLIQELMEKQNVKDIELPKLEFPTLDGKLIEPPVDSLANSNVDDAFENEAAGDEDYKPTEDELKEAEIPSPQKKVYVSAKKRSLDPSDNGNGEISTKTNKRNKTT